MPTLLFTIITEYSAWFIPVCLFIGLLYSSLLYYKTLKKIDEHKSIIIFISVLRFLVVSILCFLLLSPFIKSIERYIQKPIIVFAIDNSESVLMNKDSIYYKTEFSESINNAINTLSEKYDIKPILFGDKTEDGQNIDFSEKNTNFSKLFENIKRRFEHQNLGAIVLATDGINTTGLSVEYAYNKQSLFAPVYTVALGDTNIATDIFISDIKYNKIAFEGNIFPIKVSYTANGLEGKSTKIFIKYNNEIIDEKTINIKSNNEFEEIYFNILAKEEGLKTYKIEIVPIENELSKNNNERIAIIDILKNKQKILIYSDGPHPDMGAIKLALEKNMNFEVDIIIGNEKNINIEDFNLIIAYQIPTKNTNSKLIVDAIERDVPILFHIGTKTDINKFNKLDLGLNINQTKNITDEVLINIDKNFELFDIKSISTDFFENTSPLTLPYADYNFNFNNSTLATQKVGTVVTNKPIISFGKIKDTKIGIFVGEGIWRIRINCYRKFADFSQFDDFISKITGYMALKEKRTNFLVNANPIFNENESVVLNAELYNESYEPINTPNVSLIIKDEKNNTYNYNFNKTNNSYSLDIGKLNIGTYNYTAQTTFNSQEYSKSGSFTVIPINIEAYNTLANHRGLYKLSQQSKGELMLPNQINTLSDLINNNDRIANISILEEKLKELISYPLIFITLIIFLTLEWFGRKYFLGKD